MAKPRQTDLLGLEGASSLVPAGTLSSPNGALTRKDEQRISDETHRQMQVIQHQARKTVAGVQAIGAMHECGADQFYETMVHHEAVNQQAAGSAMQAYVEEYNRQDAKQTARHLTGAVEIGARSVAEVIAQSCIPPAREKPGFWQRVRGDY